MKKDDWYKEIKIPEGTIFEMYKGFPTFEIRLNKDMRPNGDFYFYLNNSDGSYYGVLKIDKNKNVKEIYRSATDEEIEAYNIDPKYMTNGKIFVSINDKLEITHVYWWAGDDIILRKEISTGKIRQCDCYYDGHYDNLDLPKESIEMLKKYDASYFYTSRELDTGEVKPHCLGFTNNLNSKKCTCSKKYDYIKDNLLDLENIFLS